MRYARRIPNTGPSGLAFLGAYLGCVVYGFYYIGVGNKSRRAERDEKKVARAMLIPFLQAEEDRRYVTAGPGTKEFRAQGLRLSESQGLRVSGSQGLRVSGSQAWALRLCANGSVVRLVITCAGSRV